MNMLGRGTDARVHGDQRAVAMRGLRLSLNADPASAVRLGVDQLVAQGFEERADNLPARLTAAGSEWTACAVDIGDAKKSRKGHWVDHFRDEGYLMLRAGSRVIPPTLVMVAARLTSADTCELVIYPHTSRRGNPRYATAAMPRINAAFDAVIATAAQAGRLISHESMRGIKNDGSPASQRAVRDLLDWR